MKTNWTSRYLSLAREVGSWSKDPSTKIGAVAVGDDGQILSQGYNGFPRGIADTEERLNDKETKYGYIVHGEMNCIYNACLNGVSLKGSSLYVHGLPVCHLCCNGIIQVGVKKVYMAHDWNLPEKWEESWKLSRNKLLEAGVWFNRSHYDTSNPHLLNSARIIESASRVNGSGPFVWRYSRWDESLGESVWEREYIS